MTSLVDEELNYCIEHMSQLQAKINILLKTKKEQQVIDGKKIRDIAPNLEVMRNWLDHKKVIDYDKAAEKAEHDYETFLKGINDIDTIIPNASGDHFHTPENIKIINDFNTYHGFDEKGLIAEKPKREIFVDMTDDSPSQFMKDFIEASYNLFILQQEQIDDLKSKLENYTYKPEQEPSSEAN